MALIENGNYEIDEDSNGDLVIRDTNDNVVFQWDSSAGKWIMGSNAPLDIAELIDGSGTSHTGELQDVGDAPASHASSHESGGGDTITIGNLVDFDPVAVDIGTTANQPTAGTADRIYIRTDASGGPVIERDDGTNWNVIGTTSGALGSGGADAVDVETLATSGSSGTVPESDGSGNLTMAQNNDVPSDVIAIWKGSISNIPSGWVLCDGNNSTPDLQDKFVIGAGNNFTVDQTGGSSTVTLTESELASHDHDGPMDAPNASSGNEVGEGDSNPSTVNFTNATGGDSAHENKPPFHALAYIKKT